MADYSYLSLTKFKDAIKANDLDDDTTFRECLEAATLQIDNATQRTFREYTGTRVYTPYYSDRLDIDDLLAVTTLKTDTDDDYSYDESWATTDYALWPFNAVVDGQPYTRVLTKPNGTRVFSPLSDQSVQIVGRWGYNRTLERISSLLNGALTSTATSMTIDSGPDLEELDTLLIDSEQIYVTAVQGNTITIVRGVNGTTGASHLDNAVIDRYKYPATIVKACRLQATRLFMRDKAPLGVLGGPDTGYVRMKSELDPDVLQLLGDYIRIRKGVIRSGTR